MLSSSIQAQVTADFWYGNTRGNADGYDGRATNGWKSPWIKKNLNAESDSVGVLNENPLDTRYGSESYLNVSFSSLGNSENKASSITVCRQYGDESARSDIDLYMPVKYQFLFRAESSNQDYRYMFYDCPKATPMTSPACTWIIHIMNGTWKLANGDRNGVAKDIDTKVPLVPNMVYQVIVEVSPTDGTWNVQIINAANNIVLYDSKEANVSLQFRSNATSLGGFITFGVADTTPNKTPNNYAFSIDSVSIQN